MAQTILLRRSATSGNIPTTAQLSLGEVAINTADGKMYIKKSVDGIESIVEVGGGASGTIQTFLQTYAFTASEGQTLFYGSDDNSSILAYVADKTEIYLNGILLDPANDYVATNGSSITLNTAAELGDLLQVVAFTPNVELLPADTMVSTFTGDGTTVDFTLGATPGIIQNTSVYLDGVYQEKSTYTLDGYVVTLSEAPEIGTGIEIVYGSRGITFDEAETYNFVGTLVAPAIETASLQITGGVDNQGTLSWNTEDETLDLIVSPDVTYQIGQELGLVARNLSGTTLANGAIVKVTGASGDKVTVDIADASTELGSAPTVGVVTETINNNSTGRITTAGLVRGLDTSSFSEGVAIYLGSNGAFTATKPVSPNHLVHIGWVVRSHATEGAILVHVNNGWEVDELHDVLISNVSNGQILTWNATLGVWENTDFPDALTFDTELTAATQALEAQIEAARAESVAFAIALG